MKNYFHHTSNGDRMITYSEPGKYVVLLDNVSGRFEFNIVCPAITLYVFGTYSGSQKDTYSLQTVVRHLTPNSSSSQFIKGVFDDASSFSYHGLIHIARDCNGSRASQKNQNLILSNQAIVKSQPDLEILSDKVYCTHSSSTGRLNNEVLYFLQTRGITLKQAQKTYVKGFLAEIKDQVTAETKSMS